jgi:ribonuclease HI
MLSVYCDGAAHAKQGWPGGWAFVVLRAGEVLCTQTGAAARTSNNLMELEAALRGVQAVLAAGWHLGAAVELVSDSKVALDAAAGLGAPREAPRRAAARGVPGSRCAGALGERPRGRQVEHPRRCARPPSVLESGARPGEAARSGAGRAEARNALTPLTGFSDSFICCGVETIG